MSQPQIRCPHKGKYGKTLFEGDKVLYPQYDTITDEIIQNEGVIELSTTDDWIISTANPDLIDYDEDFWAQVEKIEK